MKNSLLWSLCGLLIFHPSAFGAGGAWKPIQGVFTVWQAPLSDPIPDSPQVAFFKIEGAAAKAMFDGMRNAKVEKNACAENGLTMKIVQDLVCFKQGGKYSCNFGIGLADGKLQFGYTC